MIQFPSLPTLTPDPGPAPTPSPETPVDLRSRPFAANSPWNTAITSGAVYGPTLSVQYSEMRKGWINGLQHSVTVFYAKATDTLRTITTTEGNAPGKYQVRMPNEAAGSAGSYSDQHMLIFDADGVTVHEFYKFPQTAIGTRTTYTAGAYVNTDLRRGGWGAGWIRATSTSAAGGLIRASDLAAGVIQHKLAIALPYTVLSRYWEAPADRKDSGHPQGTGPQTGTVNYGAVLAIPKSVDLSKLGLTQGGLLVAKAMQDYGIYVVDGAGSAKIPPIYAEQAIGDHARIAEASRDIDKLIGLLAVVCWPW